MVDQSVLRIQTPPPELAVKTNDVGLASVAAVSVQASVPSDLVTYRSLPTIASPPPVIVLMYAMCPLPSKAMKASTGLSSSWPAAGAPTGSAKNVIARPESRRTIVLGVGKSYWNGLVAMVTGLGPAGNGAEC